MSLKLALDSDQLRERFTALQHPKHIADLLDVDLRSLNYWIYRTPEPKRYHTFEIPKKHGTLRRIDAPTTNIKILQQKLNQVLQSVYQPKPSVHGFTVGRNVKTNAQEHVQKRWVFNVDLENFFPSINFGRVRGMFMAWPYCLPKKVATVLAHMCCYLGQLPQGAPTSPVISNMICAQMDSQLQQLARANRSTYTRYADDITFSTTIKTFPAGIAILDDLNQLRPGNQLEQVITQNGFNINRNKIWLSGQNRRQEVTGLTVNEFPNVPRKFKNQIRAMLNAWRKHGLCAAQQEWEQKYRSKSRAPWRNAPRFKQVLKGKIEYLGLIKGQESSTYLKFLDELGELDPNLTSGRGTPLRLLLRCYDELSDGSVSPQRRGYRLEEIMNNLFKIAEISVKESFTRNAGGEQIDGAIEVGNNYYLVECKWRAKLANGGELDGLRGKVTRSGPQTMGLFISVNGWSKHVIDLMKQNPDKRMLLMDGEDIRSALAADITIIDMLRAKIEAFNLRSEPYLGVHDILARANS